ncbi:DNA-methyltransferase [Paracoccus pantotrophus]|uniref:DNA-methyltransferase n=1 Tax=Paracoccus pantotrophus TaxID=82367 RepID=UPI00142EB606|nr:site-specific DNA-methyltransferase [Paracoccus pantotrophus]
MLQNRIAWIKSVIVGGRTHGHFKPLNSRRFLNRTYEEVLHGSLRGNLAVDRLAIGVTCQDKGNLSRWRHATADLRCAGNCWHIPYETVRNDAGKFHHPAAYPLELARRCLKLHGRQGLVLDPFAGSGTTLVAAKELGWRGTGIEIDEVYAETAKMRIAETEAAGEI